MHSELTASDGEPPDSPPAVRSTTSDARRFDRRAVIRGAGAVLLTGSLAGCGHDDGDDGGGGGGGYSIDSRSVSRGD